MVEHDDHIHRVCPVIADDRWLDVQLEDIAVRTVNSTLREYDPSLVSCEIHILATDDQTIQQLNARFRHQNKPTNVLSWQAGDISLPDTLDDHEKYHFLGDIAVSYDTLIMESETFGLTLDNHLSHLLVHSTLHLVGFTHYQIEDEKRMEGLETRILATMGIANPYDSTPLNLPI